MSKEAMKLALEALEDTLSDDPYPYSLESKAITALKEALAEQPAQQEPVAWRAPNWGHSDDEWVYRDFDDPVLIADGKPSPNNEPLYTSPQAPRTWVGLSDEEKSEIKKQANYNWETTAGEYASKVQDLTEAKLKEKNT